LGLIQSIKNLLWKGGAQLGIIKSLTQLTDDDRIQTTEEEIARIKLAKRYYAGNYLFKMGLPINTVRYFNQQGNERSRTFETINVTEMVAKRIASICLNSGFDVSVSLANDAGSDDDSNSSQSTQLNDFVNAWLDSSGIRLNLEEKLQQAIAPGGMAARPYVQNNQIKNAWIRADQFFSLDSNTEEVTQAAIASRRVKVTDEVLYYYTLLEFHQWLPDGTYQITNELYKSNNMQAVGEQVPLGTDDVCSDIAPQVNITDFKRPLFAYFKCPGDNNIDPESPLGIGFVNNCQSVLDAINYVHDSFIWETRMGRIKVLTPPEMIKQADEYHQTANFDPDQDVYTPVSALNSDSNNPIVQINPDIRVQEYQQTMEFFLHELENKVGLSTGTFSTDAQGGITTATQVVSENSMTYQTRSSYLNKITKFLTDLIKSMLQLAQESQLFDDGKAPLSDIDIDQVVVSVHYDDGVFVDKDKQATQDLLVMEQKAMPMTVFLQRNYGLSEDDAKKWVAEAQQEAPEQPMNETQQEGDLLNGGDE
jgi:A118 family predicted phage portal protein